MKRWMPLCMMAMLSLYGLAQDETTEQGEEGEADRQTAKRLERQVTVELDYLLYLPEGYEEQDRWPLMVFLHGAGERGENVNDVRRHGPPRLIDQGRKLPFIVVSPQCPRGRWWPLLEREVMALVDEMTEQYKVDTSRVYLTGLSMGGYGTWSIGCSFADRFAAVLPICGGGQPYLAGALKDTPVWAFHGDADPVVPLSESQKMVDAVKRAGGNAKLTVYPGVEHDSWTRTYNNSEIYDWLLSHRKAQDQ